MVCGSGVGDSNCVERQKAFGKRGTIQMHELLVALSLSALTFIPCLVTMDESNCDLEDADAA